ncbi:MAG TPA: response regulator [Pyrinomonadaceae bacterium]|nr:response regulator [Pyrinomonadaceae bacterium]
MTLASQTSLKEGFAAVSTPASEDEVSSRILIVDDEDMVRNLFADFLSDTYICTTASSSDEALAHLSIDPYALVISDVQMPGRNGVELLREVRTRYPDTAVIMVSGISRSQRIRDALQLGASDYLIKPCELDVLRFSVERAMERRALTITARTYRADLERQNVELAARKRELERLQAQLVHSEKMASLGQLAAGVAHELNNPAGFIFGNMDLLREYVGKVERILSVFDSATLSRQDEASIRELKEQIRYDSLLSDVHSMLDDCLEGAIRIRDVVLNLRLFSRLDEADFKKVDLHESIESTIRLLSRYYGAGRTCLLKDYGALPSVYCYAGQLNQVWTNLLVNAAQAIEGDGEVRIVTRVEGDFVVVTIADTGCGIPADVLNKIFDPFFTTKAVGEGTGLGLSISYGIIEKHKGNIVAESVVGQGSKFTISIPISTPLSAGAPGELWEQRLQKVRGDHVT